MKPDLKKKAVELRKQGFSFREISEKLEISKSTASLWLRDVELSKAAKLRIEKLGIEGRKNAIKAVKKRIAKEDLRILSAVRDCITQCLLLKKDLKIICALLYWCEGGKTDKGKLSFINADPNLVKYFLSTFRKAFTIDEKRFRALIHLHEYHDTEKQTRFWSDVTGIPVAQFTKPYSKLNTGKRIKKDYQGCISVRYYGREVIKELIFLIKEISDTKI